MYERIRDTRESKAEKVVKKEMTFFSSGSNFVGGLIRQNCPTFIFALFCSSQVGQSSVVLNWQPPPSTISHSHHHDASLSTEDTLQSYIIYYTTTLKEWVEESVPDDVLTHKIAGLTPDTTYYFRMSGKWRRSGFGQTTEVKSVTTPKALTHYQTVSNGNNNYHGNGPPSMQRPNQIVLYVLIGLSILFALASVALCIYYKRKARDLEHNAMGMKKDKKMK